MKYSKNIAIMAALAVTALLAGCSAVTTPHPLSTQPKPVDKDRFEGTWQGGEGTVSVRFASNGVARLAGTEWNDEQFRLVQGEMIVAEGKKDNFISVRFEENGTWTNRYFFFQYKFTGNGDLVLWSPNIDEFEAAIKSNVLQGVVTTKMVMKKNTTSVSVTNSPGELLDFMNDPGRRNLFNYREPLVLRKIAAPENTAPGVGGD